MPFDDLTRFLQAAADVGELERISLPLQTDQEIAALTQQICQEFRDASPVILFEHPDGRALPVVTNLLGNRLRFLKALGAESFDDVVERLRDALSPIPAHAHRDWKFGLGSGAGVDRGKLAPRTLRRGLSQQVVKLGKEIDLRQFPVLRSWPGESGPIITAGQVVTESAAGRPTLEQMPLEIIDSQTLLLHWSPQGPCYRNWLDRQQDQRQLPVAVSLGGDPLLLYAASLPLPGWIDPWFFTGILRNESFNLIRARSVELNVPAEAEIVLEGYIDTIPPTGTGVSGGARGILETRHQLPVLTLSAITHRANPVFPARVQALEFNEDSVWTQLTERLLLGILRMLNFSADDLHLPACGGQRDTVFIGTSATSRYEIEQILHAACSLPFLSQAGIVVAVGPDVNLRNTNAVWREVGLSRPTDPTAASWPIRITENRLIIDATPTSRSLHAVQRCQPSSEILASLARQLGNSSWETDEMTVTSPPPATASSVSNFVRSIET